jgi:hypothetical protein
VLVLTSHLPEVRDRAAQEWLAGLSGHLVDVISINGDLAGFRRLREHFVSEELIRADPSWWWPDTPPGSTDDQLCFDFDRGL